MRKKRINKIFGIILALALPITLIGAVMIMVMFPSQELFKDMGWNQGMHNQWMNPWTDSDGWGHMNNGHMNGGNSRSITLVDGDDESFKSVQAVQVRGMVDNVSVEKSSTEEVELSYTGAETLRVALVRNRLIISTSRSGLNLNSILDNAGELVIRIPDGLKEFDTDPGASNISVTGIAVNHLDIEMGLGNLSIKTVTVSQDANIDGGKGNILVEDSEFTKLDIEGGIGNIIVNTIQAKVVELESGIGSIVVNDSTIDFLKTDQGLGSIEINNSTIREHKKD